MSCNLTTHNVTFSWSLDYEDVDVQDLLSCDADANAAAVNETTYFLNGNLDAEWNCSAAGTPTEEVTVILCSSNAVYLGDYLVDTCDEAVGDGTMIFLAHKTLICDADLSVNSLPLYVAAAAFAVTVISLTLFLYYKYTRIQIPEEEIRYQEALAQQNALARSRRLMAETEIDEDELDVEYGEEDMMALPYGEVATTVAKPSAAGAAAAAAARRSVPTTGLTSSSVEMTPLSPSRDASLTTPLEEKEEKAERAPPSPRLRAQPAPAAAAVARPPSLGAADSRGSAATKAGGSAAAGMAKKKGSTSTNSNKAKKAVDPNERLLTTPGRRAVLEWWSAHGLPARHFATLLQVGVETLEDVPFVEFDDLREFGMPAHVAREVVRLIQNPGSKFRPDGQSRAAAAVAAEDDKTRTEAKPAARSPATTPLPTRRAPLPKRTPSTDGEEEEDETKAEDVPPVTVEGWWRRWQFPPEYYPALRSIGVEEIDDIQFLERSDLVEGGMPPALAAEVCRAAERRAPRSPKRVVPPEHSAMRASPPASALAARSTPSPLSLSSRQRRHPEALVPPATIREWWDRHGFPADELPRFLRVGAEMVSDLRFVELGDLLDAGFPRRLAQHIVQAAAALTRDGGGDGGGGGRANTTGSSSAPAAALPPARNAAAAPSPTREGRGVGGGGGGGASRAAPASAAAAPSRSPRGAAAAFAPVSPADDLWTVLRQWWREVGSRVGSGANGGGSAIAGEQLFLETLAGVGVESYADLVLVEAEDLVAAGVDQARARAIVTCLASTPIFLRGADRINL